MLTTDVPSPITQVMVPVIVGTDTFKSELTIANRTKSKMDGTFAVILTANGHVEFGSFAVDAGHQLTVPDVVAELRSAGLNLPNGSVASMAISFEKDETDDSPSDDGVPTISSSDAYVGVRTYASKAGGLFGLAYGQVPLGAAADSEAYVYGLQQSGTQGAEGGTRSNLAVLHALGGSEEVLRLEVTYFGPSGQELGKESSCSPCSLKPGQLKQFNAPLDGKNGFTVPQGYARIRRLSGSDQFIAYGVLNDQANNDGSYVPMTMP